MGDKIKLTYNYVIKHKNYRTNLKKIFILSICVFKEYLLHSLEDTTVQADQPLLLF